MLGNQMVTVPQLFSNISYENYTEAFFVLSRFLRKKLYFVNAIFLNQSQVLYKIDIQ